MSFTANSYLHLT